MADGYLHNLWPSIHVYNSLGAHFAIIRSKEFENKRGLRLCSLLLCCSIIMSTVFLKQHSMFDVLTAFAMAAVMYLVVYRYDLVWQSEPCAPERMQSPRSAEKYRSAGIKNYGTDLMRDMAQATSLFIFTVISQ